MRLEIELSPLKFFGALFAFWLGVGVAKVAVWELDRWAESRTGGQHG